MKINPKLTFEEPRVNLGVRQACYWFAKEFGFMLATLSQTSRRHDIIKRCFPVETATWVFSSEDGSEPIELIHEMDIIFVRLGMMDCHDAGRFARVVRGVCFEATGIHVDDIACPQLFWHGKRERSRWAKETKSLLRDYAQSRRGRYIKVKCEHGTRFVSYAERSKRLKCGYYLEAVEKFYTATWVWNNVWRRA